MAILLADIGGTHARLAYFEAGHIKDITFFNCEWVVKIHKSFSPDCFSIIHMNLGSISALP